ncbi:prolipoprotein diacylglyceryl transferase [uncultured Amaricoccus sp.]|uniref:prolipoprotein diacylglyceryl transferase n=1 Tax=uncultured Amaricoccus sp. TaxID=339341 RepID=UPI0026066F3E|nr:prolipoprotein diacylglyceryl transferase [uncultured Amaricoccus sp.]
MPYVLPFPDIDPVLVGFNLFGVELAIRWYALAYIAGLLIGWRYVAGLCARPALWGGTAPMRPEQTDDLLTWMVLGVILGGRLGYTLFYQPAYYLANPAEILAVWRGGMSFHGGFLGVAVGVLGFSLRNGLPVARVGDAVAAAAPIGLFFGRLANFINAELWGRPSTVPWAVVFPGDAASTCPEGWVGACARHPSQLYEAGLEGVLLFLLLHWAIRRGALARPGRMIGLFLVGYGAARIIVEQFRQADGQFVGPGNPHGHVIRLGGEWGLSMGQALSLPMLVAGLALVVWSGRRT